MSHLINVTNDFSVTEHERGHVCVWLPARKRASGDDSLTSRGRMLVNILIIKSFNELTQRHGSEHERMQKHVQSWDQCIGSIKGVKCTSASEHSERREETLDRKIQVMLRRDLYIQRCIAGECRQ